MCGIHGVVRFPNLRDDDLQHSKNVSELLFHRGPDSQKQKNIDNICILGNTRLAIIDATSPGQPLCCNCGKHFLTFNGEIFNYRELRLDLEYEFHTDGDAETLLALLCTRGIDHVELLRGQFAFAFWDSDLKQLSLVVDRFGVLPLYFLDDLDHLRFSSSASSISTLGKTSEPDILSRLLHRRAITAPETSYPGVQRIPPGEAWIFSRNSLQIKKWTKHVKKDVYAEPSFKEFVFLLNQAADRIAVSDVEIGVFLSGGVDSALVAKLIQDRVPYPLKAYTAVWTTPGKINEDESASKTAKLLKLQHNKIEISAADWWRAMEIGTKYRDSPMSEPADAAFLLLAERASKDVKVVTSGEGADELFCGYPKYKAELVAEYFVVRHIASALHALTKGISNERLERILFSVSQQTRISRYGNYFSTRWIDRPTPDFRDFLNCDTEKGLNGLRNWDISHYLPSVLLDRADKMAMRSSVEVRPLFLDSDLADYALSIQARDNVSRFGTKILLKNAARVILPPGFSITKKKGFPTPLNQWLKSDLLENVSTLLLENGISEKLGFTKKEVTLYLDEHRSGKRDHTGRLFSLISLSLWLKG